MPRPTADLSSLTVSKHVEESPPSATADVGGPKGYAHTLSLRLTADQYRRLRRYVAAQEEQTGKRITHQALIEAALDTYLTKRDA